jgi:hypothetical protein
MIEGMDKKFIAVGFIALVLLEVALLPGCSSPPPSKASAVAADASAANTAAIKALTANITALSTENANLKSQIVAINKAMALMATKDEVNKAVAGSLIPKEWADVKAIANSAAGQVAMLASQQATLQSSVSNWQKANDDYIGRIVAANYASKGDVLVSQGRDNALEIRLIEVEKKLGLR